MENLITQNGPDLHLLIKDDKSRQNILKYYLNVLVMDFDVSLDANKSAWFVKRIDEFLCNKTWAKWDDFMKVCKYMEEKATRFKVSVAMFKTAWDEVHEKDS